MQTDFLITKYISKNTDNNKDIDYNIDNLKKNLYDEGILTKDYKDEDLILLYNIYENNNKNPMERECRSVIIDRKQLKIICYTCNTPISNMEAVDYILNYTDKNKEIFQCYEGTLLSVFNNNDKWYLSTRRCLDSKNSKWNETTHFDMFMDVLNQNNYTDFDSFTKKLEKDNCYYFILIHHKNKNIIDYTNKFGKDYKKLCLAFIRNKNTQDEINYNDLELQFITDDIFIPEKLTDLKSFDEENKNNHFNENPENEGVIIKVQMNNKYEYLKLQTLNYQFNKAIGPKKNIFRGLLHLYQINKLKEYFKYNPNFEKYKKITNPINNNEKYDTVGTVDAVFKVCTSELLNLFKLVCDIKTGKQQNKEVYNILPKEYKELLFAIRGLYFKIKSENYNNKLNDSENKKYLRIKDIYSYLKTLKNNEIENLLRTRKLMFNWCKLDNSPSLKIFSTISEKSDKVHIKLTAIYTNILFPEILQDDIPKK